MAEFFQVAELESVLLLRQQFDLAPQAEVPLDRSLGRVIAKTPTADENVPGFDRATMDGYAVAARGTFGASESNPAFLEVIGDVTMGNSPDCRLGNGQAARISTGGMLPEGADAVVMIEHTATLDEETIEIYRSVAPGQHVVTAGEDLPRGDTPVLRGRRLRSADLGILASMGIDPVPVYQRPTVGIISTGDEIVPIQGSPPVGKVRDINSYSLAGLVSAAGAQPMLFGLVPDEKAALDQTCRQALESCHMVLISGGSSVGKRDFTIDVLEGLPDAEILVHGIAISPGKPTILAGVNGKAVWGLPGHATSAMVVFLAAVQPFVEHVGGMIENRQPAPLRIPARLTRNIPSASGRTDFIRVRLFKEDQQWWAEPLLGQSGLIRTMVDADGLVVVDRNTEGLDRHSLVEIIPLPT